MNRIVAKRPLSFATALLLLGVGALASHAADPSIRYRRNVRRTSGRKTSVTTIDAKVVGRVSNRLDPDEYRVANMRVRDAKYLQAEQERFRAERELQRGMRLTVSRERTYFQRRAETPARQQEERRRKKSDEFILRLTR